MRSRATKPIPGRAPLPDVEGDERYSDEVDAFVARSREELNASIQRSREEVAKGVHATRTIGDIITDGRKRHGAR